MNPKRLDWVLTKALDADLTAWEESFVKDMMERRERMGDRMKISDAQEEVLERIAEKV